MDEDDEVWTAESPEPVPLTIPFDERSGCGVSVVRQTREGKRSLIGITFVSDYGPDNPHDITLDQALHLVVQVADAIREARAGEPGQDLALAS